MSGAEEKAGVKTTEVYAGQYKRIASAYEPLSKAGRQSIQDQVDYTYALFVGAVAQQRGVSEEKVLKDMADGRVFMGQQAIDAGLVDGVSTLGALVRQLNQDRASGQTSGAGAARKTSNSTGQNMSITREQLAAQAPDLLASVQAEGATAERARIQAVEGQLITGHEALINTMKFDGKSGPGDAAMAVNAAEKQGRTAQAAALASDAPQPVPQAAAPTVTQPAAGEATRAELHEKTQAHMRANPTADYVTAYKAVGGK
jgi:ClpP class serine protease